MFKWNGTDVTDIINKSRIFEVVYNKITYWKIIYDNGNNLEEEICIVRSTTGSTSSIIDELKPIFGLPKLGTHWCKNDGKDNRKNHTVNKNTTKKFLILIKCISTPDGFIRREDSLRTYMTRLNITTDNIENLLKLQVQEIYAFRELLGITKTFDSSIIIREGKGKNVYPVSFYEPSISNNNGRIIPGIVLETWFEDIDLDDVICKLVNINNVNNLTDRVCKIRSDAEIIIKRIDQENIGIVDIICSKIIQTVQTTIKTF